MTSVFFDSIFDLNEGIEFETIDITGIGMEEHRKWMWEHAKSKKAGQRPLTPQFFNLDTYLGDYEDFDEANEMDMVEEFLQLGDQLPPEIQEIEPEFEAPEDEETSNIIVYVSRSANMDVKRRQIAARLWLENKDIEYEEIDISAPENEDKKQFLMKRATTSKSDGSSSHALTPQFFNGDVYCGNYQDFDEAIENETLEEFLRLTV